MFWDPLFEHVAAASGAPPSQVKTITALLLSYPLASIFVRIPPNRPNLAHIFSIAVSTFFLVPLLGLGYGMLHLLFSALGVYAIVITLRGPHMPWVAFLFAMGHLLYNHIINTVYGVPVTEIEITFTQMVFVMNLTTFAWNVHDGRQKQEDLDESQLATRLLHVPSPLPFLGYIFFFPAMLIGPSLDYATYDSLVKHTIYQTPPPGKGEQAKATKRRIPYGRKRVAYLHLVLGLGFLAVYAVCGGRGSYSRILSEDWSKWGLLTRFGFIQFAGFVARTKYYAVWSLSEGACILTGVGFNGYDPKTGRTLWNRVRNINIISIETAESFKVLFDSWNCRTNVWLRDCVYKRLTKKGTRPGSLQSMATFVTSAVWHGVYPGYYLAFITAGLLTSLGRQFRRFVRPYFLPKDASSSSPNSLPKYPYPNASKRLYDVLGWFVVQINLNYVASSFMLLSFKDCARAFARMGYYGHILIILALIFFKAGGRSYLRKGLPKDVKTTPKGDSKPATSRPPPPPEDEKDPSDLRWVKHALDNPPYQDSGEGVHPDGGMLDEWMQPAETPGVEKPRPKTI